MKSTREFYCDLTDEDIVERSEEQNQLLYEVAQLEAKRRDIGQQIKPKNERVDELMYIIRNRKEKRDVECIWSYDWARGVKSGVRTDTGEVIETDTIKDHEKQPELPIPSAVPGPLMFSNCPSCLYVKSGNPCAAALCGNPAMISRSIPGPCEHPIESRVEESNVVTCGVCKSVLDVAPITREMQPVDLPETITMAVPEDEQPPNLAEEIAFIKKHPSLPIDKNRTCCYPHDRDIKIEGNVRIMHCRVCGLIAKKEDYSDLANIKPVAFQVGERVAIEGRAA